MAISLNRYVSITSGVGGATAIAGREFIARLFTANDLLPPQTYVEFTSAAQVGSYFGTSSEEYLRALYYFSFVSKDFTQPQKISFARWAQTAQAAMIFGYADPANPQALSHYTSISNGSFKIAIDGTPTAFTGLDFTGDVSLAGVAATIQTAVQLAGGSYSTATVTYDATAARFVFTYGATGAHTIAVQDGSSGTNIAEILEWSPQATFTNGVFSADGAIWANGSAAEDVDDCFNASVAQSNNFGSFCFMPTSILDQANMVLLANANAAQGVSFIFDQGVSVANASAWSTAVKNTVKGVGLTLSPLSAEYPEMLPMAIQAATNYSANNSVQNYMFQQSTTTLTPSVTTDTAADTYDNDKINYYGQTQQAGAFISFYQRGVLSGTSTDPADMTTYANEIWLKDAASVALMNLLLSVSQVPANAQGRNMVLSTLQAVINQGLLNGTISVAKPLTNLQITFVSEVTGDPDAWHQVQNNGYWVDAVITPTTDVPPQYTMNYTLVYSKDDVIRKVIGTDILI